MPEVRLIDANALLKRLQEQQKYGSMQDSRGRAKAILEVIHAPTIEAEPVRHGRWIFGSSNTSSWMKCSICCKSQSGQTATFSYCPNCGARMDLRTPTEVQLDEADSVMMTAEDVMNVIDGKYCMSYL